MGIPDGDISSLNGLLSIDIIHDKLAVSPEENGTSEYLPLLKFDPAEIKLYLRSIVQRKQTSKKGRRRIQILFKKFDTFLYEGKERLSKSSQLKKKPSTWKVSPVEASDESQAIQAISINGSWEVTVIPKRKRKRSVESDKKMKTRSAKAMLDMKLNNESVVVANSEEDPQNKIICSDSVNTRTKTDDTNETKDTSKDLNLTNEQLNLKPEKETEIVIENAPPTTQTEASEIRKKLRRRPHLDLPPKDLTLEKKMISKCRTRSRKRVAFALKKNTFQEVTEHRQNLKRNPKVPWDASMKPKQSVLKPTNCLGVPVNPFYKL